MSENLYPNRPMLDIGQITAQYFDRIHRAALMLTGNPWDADDLAQETFLVLSRQSERFEGRSSMYTYLYGILLNLDRRERRRHGIHKRKLQVLWDDQPGGEATAAPADAVAEVKEWKTSLWSVVAELPEGQRQAIVLRFSEGLRYEEIAETLGCPLGTVKSRIFHGLQGVRRMLEEQGETMRDAPEHPHEDISHAV